MYRQHVKELVSLYSAILDVLGRRPISSLGSVERVATTIAMLIDGALLHARFCDPEEIVRLVRATVIPFIVALTVPAGEAEPPESVLLYAPEEFSVDARGRWDRALRDVESTVVYTAHALQQRIEALGGEVSRDYSDRDPILVCVLKGAFLFFADLIRHVTVPCQHEFMCVSSYEGTESSGEIAINMDLGIDIEGRHVLIVEDIVDTGQTIEHLIAHLTQRRPASLEVCTLLVRKGFHRKPQYFGCEVDKGYVIGMGITSTSDTGVETGSAVLAATAPNITKANLELGGKAPAIVMGDADLTVAVNAVTASRVINSGQVCNCVEGVYVQRAVVDEFMERLAASMKDCRYGDPLADETVDYGPLIKWDGFRKVDGLVSGAVGAGASVVTGGRRGEGEGGYFYEPTVLAGCRQDMEIIRREIFGPVVPIVTFEDLDEAITYANDSDYGLTSSVYTRDLNVALKVCQELGFGETYINRENFEAMQGFHAGWRKSGIGGADGRHGLHEFLQTHVVYMQRY